MSISLRLAAIFVALTLSACGGMNDGDVYSAADVEAAFADEGFVLIDSGLFDPGDEVIDAFFSAEDPRDDDSVEPVLYVGVFDTADDARQYAIPDASPFESAGAVETSANVVPHLAPNASPAVSVAARRAMSNLG